MQAMPIINMMTNKNKNFLAWLNQNIFNDKYF